MYPLLHDSASIQYDADVTVPVCSFELVICLFVRWLYTQTDRTFMCPLLHDSASIRYDAEAAVPVHNRPRCNRRKLPFGSCS
jgi:hypothetical protein